MDRRSEALAQLLETALSERFATPVIELLQATPIPVAVVQVSDLRVLALNELMARVYDALRESPVWDRTMLVIAYDEAGGFFDHVVPPVHVVSPGRHRYPENVPGAPDDDFEAMVSGFTPGGRSTTRSVVDFVLGPFGW